MQIPFIDLKSQYLAYQQEIDQAIHQVIDQTSFINGKVITELEEELAAYTQAKHAICCSSGTDALILALMAIELRPGDEVITTAFTFVATAEAIALLGGKPVFIDIEPDGCLMNPEKIAAAITSRTRAVMPVSLFGQTADMDAIHGIAAQHQLTVIEDAAQSFGASYKGRKSCALSPLACTSFFPAKPLGCYGDGGAVFTEQADLAEKCLQLRNHGQSDQYNYQYIGINGRLDSIQAAVLRVKLQHFEQEVKQRRQVAQIYDQLLADAVQSGKIRVLKEAHYGKSVYAQYSLVTETREQRASLMQQLHKANVPVKIYYPNPLHQQQPYYSPIQLPVTEQLSQTIFSIPISPFISEAQQHYVVDSIIRCLKNC